MISDPRFLAYVYSTKKKSVHFTSTGSNRHRTNIRLMGMISIKSHFPIWISNETKELVKKD